MLLFSKNLFFSNKTEKYLDVQNDKNNS